MSENALGRLLAGEAHRAAVGFAPDQARLADGWEYRFVVDGRRVEESVQLYRELGFEVAADAVGPALSPECRQCELVAALQFRAIYTRRPGGA